MKMTRSLWMHAYDMSSALLFLLVYASAPPRRKADLSPPPMTGTMVLMATRSEQTLYLTVLVHSRRRK